MKARACNRLLGSRLQIQILCVSNVHCVLASIDVPSPTLAVLVVVTRSSSTITSQRMCDAAANSYCSVSVGLSRARRVARTPVDQQPATSAMRNSIIPAGPRHTTSTSYAPFPADGPASSVAARRAARRATIRSRLRVRPAAPGGGPAPYAAGPQLLRTSAS
eukprot:366229-Chlamydomonas_euryale.AAC.12